MNCAIKDRAGLNPHLQSVFAQYFLFDPYQISESLSVLDRFLNNFRKDISIGIETPYVDKLYRATYYQYYSSKLSAYGRDCIRLSFFSAAITLDDFFTSEGHQRLQENFLGFLVLRPTSPNIIGRNLLRPDVFNKASTFYTAITKSSASINGLKLEIEGFPHASQDSELMVCAETTLWSLMEYFSNRYADYKPIMPKDIHNILSYVSMQRQVPSDGLTGLQISYALKELGFGVKMYSANSYTGAEFHRMIQIYIESGIPVVTAIANHNGIGHVLNLVGRTEFNDGKAFKFSEIYRMSSGSVIYDFYEQPANYLVIDDNLPPYSTITLNDPACNYSDALWQGCIIVAAIVPLYHRIYMEADRAKQLAIQQLFSLDYQIKLPSYVLKVFLSSSRSFKHSIVTNPDIDPLVKALIQSLELPKFVWIAELSTPDLILQNKANGLIIMDATEPKKLGVLASLLENSYIGTINGQYNRYSVPLQPFRQHCNLKPF